MQRNKYLDDLGIPIEDYGTNFTDDNDQRASDWGNQREIYGFDTRECWNLDQTFIEWLYSHVMMYYEETIVVLNYHKYEFEGKSYTQKEAIEHILELCRDYLTTEFVLRNGDTAKKVTRLFAEILPAMWW